jgi:hypothetical protein
MAFQRKFTKKNGKVINNYYYSSDGLLTKSEEYDSYLKSWSFAQFVYSEKNLLVESKLVLRGMSYLFEYLRDSLGRIEGIKSKGYRNNSLDDMESIKGWELQVRYIYNNGILEKVGPYTKKPKEPLYEGGGWTFSFDPYGRGIWGGEGDGGWHVTFDKSGKLATIVGEFYGMASLYTDTKTITYKRDLMDKIIQIEQNKITDWNYAKISKTKPSYKKTITTITYEYGYKKKK